MRSLAVATLALVCVGSAAGQGSIRQVDFKNFTYPLSGPTLGHDRLQWLDLSTKRHIGLQNGKDASGFSLSSAQFADVTGEGKEDAIVVLHFDTGGTQQTDYVYIYSFKAGKPKLLAYCHTGDRAYSGLFKVYGESGKIVFELLDPKKAIGDCCSTGFIRTRYKWKNGIFMPNGVRQFGKVKIKEYSPSGAPISGTAQ